MELSKQDTLRQIENLFDHYTETMSWSSGGGRVPVLPEDWSPRVDVSETETEFLIKAEIPEVRKEDVKVSVDHGVLTLQGERRQSSEEKGVKLHRIERYYGNFIRCFLLPLNADGAHVTASFKDGMLGLHIPKIATAEPPAQQVKIE